MAVVSANSKNVKILPKYFGLLVFRPSKRIWWVKYIWHKSIISTHFILSWKENFVNLSKNSEGNKEPFRVSISWKFFRSHIQSFCLYSHETGNCWCLFSTLFFWPWPLLLLPISKIKKSTQGENIFLKTKGEIGNFGNYLSQNTSFCPDAFFN